MLTKSEIFINFISSLEKEQVNYALLGNTINYPHDIQSDVDVVFNDETYLYVEEFINNFCTSNNLILCNCLQHEIGAKYFVVASIDDIANEISYLAIDICSNYYRQARLLISSTELLLSTKYFEINTGFKYKICNDVIAFTYYFIKKAEKQSLNIEQITYLQGLFNRASGEIINHLSTIFTQNIVNKIEYIFTCKKYEYLDVDFLRFMNKYLHEKYRRTLIHGLMEYNRRLRRILKPTGLVIALMGCDGSGKSTIIKDIQHSGFADGPFRDKFYFHLFPSFKASLNNFTNTHPHSQPTRSNFQSNLKLIYFFGKYFLGYWLITYPKKMRSTLVIFDRYYHDILIDPLRYRHSGSKWLTDIIGKLIPKPDIYFFIDAPEDVILSRKQEVAPQEVKRQRNGYLYLSSTLKNSYIIDNNRLPKHASFLVKKLIINRLKKNI